MYVYQPSDGELLWTVGYYADGHWVPESDHGTEQAAAERVHWLNGGRTLDQADRAERRERIATAALQGLLAGGGLRPARGRTPEGTLAAAAVRHADALLTALER